MSRKGVPSDESAVSLRVSPTGVLRSAGARMLKAKSADAVAEIAASAAVDLCSARSAIWWEWSSRRLSAKHACGIELRESSRVLRDADKLLILADDANPALVLSRDSLDHVPLLDQVGARRGILIPAPSGRRWLGALSVHDGRFDSARVDLLVALTQQTASALRSLEAASEIRQLAREQRSAAGQFGGALTSALSLDELLGIVCRLAMGAAEADACLLFLADEEPALRLRAQLGPIEAGLETADLLTLADRVRHDADGIAFWRLGERSRDGVPETIARSQFRSMIGLTLAVRGEPLGALLLLSKRDQAVSGGQSRRMLSFAAQVAVAVENLQLFESTQQRLLEMADLRWVSGRVAASHDIGSIAATITDAAAKALDAPRVALFLVGREGRFEPLPADSGAEYAVGVKVDLPPEGHIGAEAVRTGAPQIISDTIAENRCDDALVQWLQARSLLCVPMVAQQGLRGLFVAADDRPRAFNSHAIGLLSNYSNQASLALQSAILYQDVVRHLNELSRLFEVSRSLASSLDLSENLNTVLTSAAELLDAPVCSVMLSDPEAGDLVVKAAHGFWPDDELYERIKPGQGLAGRAVQSGMALTSSDLSRDGRFRFRQRAREEGLRTAIAAPLIARGRTLGVISLYRKASREFGEDDKRLLMSLADSAAVAIENANLYREAQERADFLGAMMSEINHRIRNTLQAIAGLLRMELDRPHVSAEDAIQRGIARIQAVAVVHEVMRAQEVKFVDMKQVAGRITQIMCQSIDTKCPVDFVITGARVALPSQKATNVALIFAELIDNALRHGLAQAQNGRVSIALAEAGGEVVVQVRDNGAGVPEGFDLDADSGLGLKIVRGLVEDELEGTIEIETNQGMIVRARFPKV